jgi:hypothetical protein
VQADGDEAIARGIEIAMLGAANTHAASWEFNVFRNRCVKEDGVWKVQDIEITPLMVADYYEGWGRGGLRVPNTYLPPFLNVTGGLDMPSPSPQRSSNATVEDLTRRLLRSAAFDGSENLSHAYGYYADDILGPELGGLFAKQGHKLSPFAGFFHTPARITGAMTASYGTNRSTLRTSVSYHWRPQPVILVSQDGRSATMRARLLQPSTSITKAGSFNSAIYHEQVVLEEGKWRLWSVTIDEFYWQSTSWKEGWANAKPRNSSAPNPEPAGWTKKYSPRCVIGGGGRAREHVSRRRGKVDRVAGYPAHVVPVSQSCQWESAGVVLARVRAMSGPARVAAGSQRLSRAFYGAMRKRVCSYWADTLTAPSCNRMERRLGVADC